MRIHQLVLRPRVAVAAGVITITLAALAAPRVHAPAAPRAPARLEGLARSSSGTFLGTWHCQMRHAGGRTAAGRTVRQKLDVYVVPGEEKLAYHLAPEATGDPGDPITSTRYWSFDGAKGVFTSNAKLGAGATEVIETASSDGWQGDRLVWLGVVESSVTVLKRQSLVRTSATTLEIHNETKGGDDAWTRTVDGTCRR